MQHDTERALRAWRLRDSYRRAGDEAGFIAYVADLRQRHHRKTSFITKLDKALVRH